jgi:hypothetical protein
MKKLGFFALALSMSALLSSAPTFANNDKANDKPSTVTTQDQPPLPDVCFPFYKEYFEEKTDFEKKYAKAKTFLEKCPEADPYWKKGPESTVKKYELNKVREKCVDADKLFFTTPNEANLNNFTSACDMWISKSPTPDFYFPTRLATGTGFGVLAGFNKDTVRATNYAEKALKSLSQTTTPPEWKDPDWANFRKDNIARLIQYKGLYKLRQATPDYEGAIKDFNDAVAIKDGPAIKDPNSYLLRAEAVTVSYTKYNDEYNALTDEEKRGEKGKAALAKIYPVVARLANDYARVVAVTEGKPEYKAIYDDSKVQAEEFYKFLKNGKTAGIDELYKRFKADVGALDVEIKVEESAAPKSPVGKGKKTTATATAPAGGGTAAPTAGGDAAAAATKPATGKTAATTKTAAPKKRK